MSLLTRKADERVSTVTKTSTHVGNSLVGLLWSELCQMELWSMGICLSCDQPLLISRWSTQSSRVAVSYLSIISTWFCFLSANHIAHCHYVDTLTAATFFFFFALLNVTSRERTNSQVVGQREQYKKSGQSTVQDWCVLQDFTSFAQPFFPCHSIS